jgi:hypothetical protein
MDWVSTCPASFLLSPPAAMVGDDEEGSEAIYNDNMIISMVISK